MAELSELRCKPVLVEDQDLHRYTLLVGITVTASREQGTALLRGIR
jgi:hypothetical protein